MQTLPKSLIYRKREAASRRIPSITPFGYSATTPAGNSISSWGTRAPEGDWGRTPKTGLLHQVRQELINCA